jgi:hypothetical protein
MERTKNVLSILKNIPIEKEHMIMDKKMIDWRSLVIGILLGTSVILIAAQSQKASDPGPQWQIATGNSTWVVNTGTGEIWELTGEAGSTEGSSQYKLTYAGKPSK